MSSRVKEKAVYQFERQHPMDLGRIIPISLEVAKHDAFEPLLAEVRPRERT